jgi:hypothetical protein
MGQNWHSVAAASLFGMPIPLAWDVWEYEIAQWVSQLQRFSVSQIIVTSEKSQSLLSSSNKNCRVLYAPEAIRVADFFSGDSLEHRQTQVLELGRRHPQWHDTVTPSLASKRVTHLYERQQGEIIFPTRSQLITGLAGAAISVCFPRSWTHPEQAGKIEMLTQRYFESMASGCLVLGHASRDLIDLFGYNPVIEVDWKQPKEQLNWILGNLGQYQAFVEKNLQRVREVGDWSQRSCQILELLHCDASPIARALP